MADEDPPRSLAARAAAELALVRIADYYGGGLEFVLLGGLVPALLCAQSSLVRVLHYRIRDSFGTLGAVAGSRPSRMTVELSYHQS